MAGLKLIVVGASLLCLTMGQTLDGQAQAGPSSNLTVEHEAQRVDCLGPMNAARTAVGLTGFAEAPTDGNRLPVIDVPSNTPTTGNAVKTVGSDGDSGDNLAKQKTFLSAFCSSVKDTGSPAKPQNQEFGTYMYYPQNSNATSCDAAVEYWKSAASNFSGLPPVYSTNEKLYTNTQNVSFVGLFNTGAKPTVDCAVITCKSGKTTVEGSQSRRLASENTEPSYSLICLSSPQALQEAKAPFTQEQWNKITGAENSGSQPAVFGLLVMVTAGYVQLLF